MLFDEKVFLAVVGGGFLRTPYLHSTREMPDNVDNDFDCGPIDGQIVHIPSAHRVSSLNADHPPFRRVILTSELTKRISTSQALIYNQEQAGITFGFHDQPAASIAHAFINDHTKYLSDPAFILDNIDIEFNPEDQQMFVNTEDDTARPTGYLLFISRHWRDERHVDPNMLMRHHVPLQYDQEFDYIPLMDGKYHFTLPIYGAKGKITAWDMRLPKGTPEILNPVPDEDNGVIDIKYDDHGAPYLEIHGESPPDVVVPLAIEDESGQFFTRNLVTQGVIPDISTVLIPTQRVNTPMNVLIKVNYAVEQVDSDDSEDIARFAPEEWKVILPEGVSIVQENGELWLRGTPTEYGPFYSLHGIAKAECEDCSPPDDLIGYFAVNRPPRTLMTLGDCQNGSHGTTAGNDYHTGEYYAMQFLPWGISVIYAGWAYRACRRISTTFRNPYLQRIPYVYGWANRRSGMEQELLWRWSSDQVLAEIADPDDDEPEPEP